MNQSCEQGSLVDAEIIIKDTAGRGDGRDLSDGSARDRSEKPILSLVLRRESSLPRRYTFNTSRIYVGRHSSADVRLDDEDVALWHAELESTRDGVVLRDLGGSSGTLYAGVPIREIILRSGVEFQIGGTSLRFYEGEPPASAAVRSSEESCRFGRALGSTEEMQRVFEMLKRLAPTDVSVTLIGETGSGKDVLAQAIHESSARASGPFVVFDCGAIAPTLAESELFGHERGAFTGAVQARQGAFERASGGTLFLDEIGEMPIDLQPRLLRALEHRHVRRVGGSDLKPVDVRVIAATNRDLQAEVAAGRFRQDLYFRLSAAVVRMPPLRERTDDLPVLVRSILDELGVNLEVPEKTFAALRGYTWPGNVRELRNVIASAVAFVDGSTLEPEHLLFFRADAPGSILEGLPLGGMRLEHIEREAIRQTLKQETGNKTRAARILGIAVSTLYEKLKKYDL